MLQKCYKRLKLKLLEKGFEETGKTYITDHRIVSFRAKKKWVSVVRYTIKLVYVTNHANFPLLNKLFYEVIIGRTVFIFCLTESLYYDFICQLCNKHIFCHRA